MRKQLMISLLALASLGGCAWKKIDYEPIRASYDPIRLQQEHKEALTHYYTNPLQIILEQTTNKELRKKMTLEEIHQGLNTAGRKDYQKK